MNMGQAPIQANYLYQKEQEHEEDHWVNGSLYRNLEDVYKWKFNRNNDVTELLKKLIMLTFVLHLQKLSV